MYNRINKGWQAMERPRAALELAALAQSGYTGLTAGVSEIPQNYLTLFAATIKAIEETNKLMATLLKAEQAKKDQVGGAGGAVRQAQLLPI
ncbi:hypothetical protein [Pseudophaeobacter leonis]|uniref:hypothetical protein n=1 Tax=Pseudophaeobacter leonis TaxID=1144477 RepID=UPI00111C6638|nr:hypothetical protein [Pseudophaeobacter leonis]